MSGDIAVVILDTVRADVFDRHFEWLPGKRFTHAFSASHHSVPSHASVFTGRYPSEIGVHVKSPALDCPDPTVAEQLQAAGYETYGFHENGHLESWAGWDRGFDRFTKEVDQPDSPVFDWEEFGRTNGLASPLDYLTGVARCIRSDTNTYDSLRNGVRRYRDADFLAVRIEELACESPTFLFVNLIDAHQPYDAPRGFFSFDEPVEVHNVDSYTDPGHDQARIRQAYDEGVTYLSARYEKIFDTLTETFDYVLTAADHGELLGEHGGWTHGPGIYPEITHIPLVLSGPDVPETTCDAAVSLLDVHATVCEIAGVSHNSRGQDLRGDVDSIPRLTEYHGTQPWQYTSFVERGIPEKFAEYDVRLDGIVGEGFYGYQTTEGLRTVGDSPWPDPEARLAELREQVPRREPDDSWLSVTEATDEELDDAVHDRLDSLGYI
jgi:arylsulfatase A-like enzyme